MNGPSGLAVIVSIVVVVVASIGALVLGAPAEAVSPLAGPVLVGLVTLLKLEQVHQVVNSQATATAEKAAAVVVEKDQTIERLQASQ